MILGANNYPNYNLMKTRTAILSICFLITTVSTFAQAPADTANRLSSESYINRYGNLDNFRYRINNQKNITVAFLGGSITNMTGWRGKTEAYLTATYPGTRFNFINAGISSLGSLPHAFRFKTDVLTKGPIDLLFIEAAVNDKANETAEIIQRRAMEGIIRHALNTNPLTDIVLMAFADEFKNADYNAGKTPVEVQVHQDMASYYHFNYINLAKEINDRINHNEFTWKDDFKSIHPSPFGQQLYFNTIRQMFIVEMQKYAPVALVKHQIPKTLNPLNYETGDYLNITNAYNLKGFKLIPIWHPVDSVHTRAGFVDVPVLEAGTAGSSFQIDFRGTVVGIGFIAGPDVGMLNYTIDGKPYPAIDIYRSASKNLHLPSYMILGDDLSPGKHKLKATVASEHNKLSKGTACRIVYYLSNAK